MMALELLPWNFVEFKVLCIFSKWPSHCKKKYFSLNKFVQHFIFYSWCFSSASQNHCTLSFVPFSVMPLPLTQKRSAASVSPATILMITWLHYHGNNRLSQCEFGTGLTCFSLCPRLVHMLICVPMIQTVRRSCRPLCVGCSFYSIIYILVCRTLRCTCTHTETHIHTPVHAHTCTACFTVSCCHISFLLSNFKAV